MARPPHPLIVREVALQSALDLIEENGYEQFSLPRLAKRLGVQPPSLYHHFRSRADLLLEATRSVIDSVELPSADLARPWRDWCLDTALAMRDMILARPGVAPLITWYLSTLGMPELRDQLIDQLREYGIPREHCVLVVFALERMTVGSAAVEAMRNRSANPRYTGDDSPDLTNDAESRALFAASVVAFLAGVNAMIEAPLADGGPSLRQVES